MIREIIKPESNVIMLNLPDEMVGKTIEVVAAEICFPKTDIKKTVDQLNEELEGLTLNLTDFKFDRNEANDYE